MKQSITEISSGAEQLYAALWTMYEEEKETIPPTAEPIAWSAWKRTKAGKLFDALVALGKARDAIDNVPLD